MLQERLHDLVGGLGPMMPPRAVVLAASGKVFCAVTDLKEVPG